MLGLGHERWILVSVQTFGTFFLEIFTVEHRPDQTRPKKIAEGGVCMREHADNVPRSVIHSCSRKALLKCKTDPF